MFLWCYEWVVNEVRSYEGYWVYVYGRDWYMVMKYNEIIFIIVVGRILSLRKKS